MEELVDQGPEYWMKVVILDKLGGSRRGDCNVFKIEKTAFFNDMEDMRTIL